MKSRPAYRSIWDIIEAILQTGAVLYGPSISSLMYPSRHKILEEDLIRAHYYPDDIHDVMTLDKMIVDLGYTEIENISSNQYRWYYIDYEFSPDIELSFTPPKLRVSVRPYISYHLRISDSLCLTYDPIQNEYRFFYAGVYLFHQGQWRLIHDIKCLGYIRVRTLHNRSLLYNCRTMDRELHLEHNKDKIALRRDNKYIIFKKDNPYLH